MVVRLRAGNFVHYVGLYSGGLIIRRAFTLRLGGLFSGGLIIGWIFASGHWGVYIPEGLLS